MLVTVAKPKPDPVRFAGDAEPGTYKDPRPINQLFLITMRAIYQASDPIRKMNLSLAFNLRGDQARARDDVGVFSADIDHFHCTLNWTTKPAGAIPPGHILVTMNGEEVAMLAPFADGKLQNGWPAQNWWKGRVVRPVDLKEAAATTIASQVEKANRDKKVDLFRHYGGHVAQQNGSIAHRQEAVAM